MRKSKTVNGITTSHIWDGENVVEDITNGNKTKYLRGINLISLQSNNNTYYYHFDGHGDVKCLTETSENAEVVASYDYDAFGNQFTNTDTANINPFRYCGEYYDAETGNIYLRNRYYDSKTGRFITEDPARDGLNWYVYCGNNPVMFVDPLGLRGTNEKIIPYPANKGEKIKGIQIAEIELNTHLKDGFSIGKYVTYTYGYKYTSKYYNLVSTKYAIKYGGGAIEFFYSTFSGNFPEISPEVSSGVSITDFILSILGFDEKIEKAKEDAKIIAKEPERYALIPEGASDEWIRSFYITKLNEIADNIQKNKSYTFGEKFIATNYIYNIVDMCVNYKKTKERVEELVE